MLSPEVRHRLRQIHARQRTWETLPPCPAKIRSQKPPNDVDQRPSVSFTGKVLTFCDGHEIETGHGPCWRIEYPLADLVDSDYQQSRPSLIDGSTAQRSLEPLAQDFLVHHPLETLFFDIETCGLAGTAVFLIGLIHASPRGLVLRQFLARHFAEEPAILSAFHEVAARARFLVSFNGKSFDWPQIQDRTLVHRIFTKSSHDASENSWKHWDLLHAARRRWKDTLPDCKLQTLEERICRRSRNHDLPGAQVPQQYLRYLATGEGQLLDPILQHNALDLMTLVDLAVRLSSNPQVHAQKKPSSARGGRWPL